MADKAVSGLGSNERIKQRKDKKGAAAFMSWDILDSRI